MKTYAPTEELYPHLRSDKSEVARFDSNELPAPHPELDEYSGASSLYRSHDWLPNGSDLWIADQGERPTGSFKIAGIGNQVLRSLEREQRHFVLASAGSAALALAEMARALGERGQEIDATINLPRTIAPERAQKIARLGGERVRLCSDFEDFDTASRAAEALAASSEETVKIEPFNHTEMLAGDVAVIEDVVDKMRLQTDKELVLAMGVGGAGLLSAAAYVASRRDDMRVVGVQYGRNQSAARSIERGDLATIDTVDSLCAGSAVRTIGQKNLQLLQAAADKLTIVTASEPEIGEKLYRERLRASEHAAAIGGLAYETSTEATGLLGRVGAEKVETSSNEAVVAIDTGANADPEKEDQAVQTYLDSRRQSVGSQRNRIFYGGPLTSH